MDNSDDSLVKEDGEYDVHGSEEKGSDSKDAARVKAKVKIDRKRAYWLAKGMSTGRSPSPI